MSRLRATESQLSLTPHFSHHADLLQEWLERPTEELLMFTVYTILCTMSGLVSSVYHVVLGAAHSLWSVSISKDMMQRMQSFIRVVQSHRA